MPPVVTLQDVADRAGVSRATASLALRGLGRMSDETRERIRRAADDLDYVVNITARNLRTSRSGAVGLYVPDNGQSYRYYMDVAFGAVARAQEDDVLVTLVPTARDLRAPMLEQLDGYIVVDPVDDDPMVARLLESRRPVVTGEFPPEGVPEPWAAAFGDHRAGMRMLLDHVWERGARRPVALLPTGQMSWSREMIAAHEEWCVERGVPVVALQSFFGTSEEELRARVEELLRRDDRPDAVITAPEGMATLALETARLVGLEVGRDLLLASYVDSDGLRLSAPSVTALDLNPREMGRTTAELLLGALDGSVARGERRVVPIALIERESTAALPR
ncbi:LacI family DNA-binding transcriptional regulator [Microbacterium fluvii]|uniref:LacI family DNA-binding transcriptional regulator n=1 Tax=Microbacterium fluvii TaxID=415215 RepID=A0ABW2HJJ9_9MICO|nr:LacI family DNA-binding transcriptional regulator [Microbacterium fluvii]MCU4673467.1 LacI family transcriptional regulator [Microbacterium fluvii]